MTHVSLLLVVIGACTVSAHSQQLVLRLFVPESTICKGAKDIPVRLEFQNVGPVPLQINTTSVGSGFDAMALYNTESNAARFESLQLTGDRITRPVRRPQLLQPGAMHGVDGLIILDQAFFAEPGFYKVRTDYFDRGAEPRGPARRRTTHVTSNWVILQVEACSPKTK